jgi:hypothetical protein
MSKDENDRLDRIEKLLTRIETAVLGDPDAGAMGLVYRTNNHGKRISRIEKFGAYVIGGSFVVSVLWTVFTQWPR